MGEAMDEDWHRTIYEKLERIDRRIGVLGDILLNVVAFTVAWLAYRLINSDLGFGDALSGGAAFVAWIAVWMTLGHRFDK